MVFWPRNLFTRKRDDSQTEMPCCFYGVFISNSNIDRYLLVLEYKNEKNDRFNTETSRTFRRYRHVLIHPEYGLKFLSDTFTGTQ